WLIIKEIFMKYLKDTVMNKIGLFTLIALIFSTSCNNKERGIIDNKYAEKREIKTNEFHTAL
ncbi:MAG: hypothetical protein PHF34_08620, partial [Bacteroidales bacterium]|nr:hypothetical protein [Bacteroidales bacterium]